MVEVINEELRRKIRNLSKMQLLRDVLAYSSEKSETLDELCSFVKKTLRKIEITRDFKLLVLREFKTRITVDSLGLYSILGKIENSDGKNTLEFIRNDLDQLNKELKSLSDLISDGLVIEEFMSMELNKRYKLINDENLDSKNSNFKCVELVGGGVTSGGGHPEIFSKKTNFFVEERKFNY